MMFALIDAKKANVPVGTACAVLGVSVSGFYAWKSRPASARQTDDLVMLAHIRAEFSASNETYGSPRMHAELKESGLPVGLHRVARLMRENGLKARQKTRFKKTTDSDHGGPVARHVLDQDFSASAPDQKWGVDISYIWTAESWLYLAIVLDLFSRRIVGWQLSDRMKRGVVPKARGARRDGCLAARDCPAATTCRLGPSFGSRQPILLGRLPTNAARSRLPRVDERARQLL